MKKILLRAMRVCGRISVGLILFFIDSIFLLLLPKRVSNQHSVLIVRTDRIGDYVVWAGQLDSLRMRYPSKTFKLTLVANEVWASLASRTQIFDEVIALDATRFIHSLVYRFQLVKQLRSLDIGVALNPMYSRDFYRSDALIRFASAPIAIGFIGDPNRAPTVLRWLSNFYYTQLIPNTDEAEELVRAASFMRFLDVQADPQLAALSVDLIPKRLGLEGKRYFVICPGSSSANRRWPVENFVDVIKYLQQKSNLCGVICGNGADQSLALKINQLLIQPLVDLTGRTSIEELISVIARADLVCANESGITHIAAALRVPTVAIVGGGHYGRFLPYPNSPMLPKIRVVNFDLPCYGCNWQCQYTSSTRELVPCIEKVSVSRAIAAIDQLIL